MKYKDRDGRIRIKTTNQDKLLRAIYQNTAARLLMRPLLCPSVSRAAGRLLDAWPSAFLISSFVRKQGIRLCEYEPKRYRSYNDFFTRRIRPACRPIDAAVEHLISPCDGKLSVFPIRSGSVFTVKQTAYTVGSLLQDEALGEQFEGGVCVLLRLTVDDYHRYCYIDDGYQGENHWISGCLHTVNPAAVEQVPVYKENSRCYCVMETKRFGSVVQVEVGAMMVGRIQNPQECCAIVRGQEKGYFAFGGSSVLLLFEKGRVRLDADLWENTKRGYETVVKQGSRIGVAVQREDA